jgi:hypothetical protein
LTIVVPDEVEVEEDLGPIEEEEVLDEVAGHDDTSFFDIGIDGEKEGDSSDDDEEANDQEEEAEEEEEEEEIEVPIIQKRQRKANTMIGGVRKGKYSICY